MEIPVKTSQMKQGLRWSEVRSRLLRSVWTLLCGAFIATPAASQTVKVMSIYEAIRNRPDYSAIHHGETITVTGVVTDGSHDVGSGASLANLQDASGGIALFGEHTVLPPGAFQRGDVLEAR